LSAGIGFGASAGGRSASGGGFGVSVIPFPPLNTQNPLRATLVPVMCEMSLFKWRTTRRKKPSPDKMAACDRLRWCAEVVTDHTTVGETALSVALGSATGKPGTADTPGAEG
jgi:hypothetical protein